jgi:hypothetical protein
MRDRGRSVRGFVWALVPAVSFGLATWVAFLYPAIRFRKVRHWLAAVAYFALFVTMVASAESTDGSAGDIVFGVAFLLSWLGGTAHAFVVRSRLSEPRTPVQDAVLMAERRKEMRRQARETVGGDVVMAWELRIGRPDLPRVYDDGGLVDVNHAPPELLASLPGMTPALVNRIVRTREQCGGFVSVEELSALAELPPALTPQLDEYAIFLP